MRTSLYIKDKIHPKEMVGKCNLKCHVNDYDWGAGRSSEVERSLMVR